MSLMLCLFIFTVYNTCTVCTKSDYRRYCLTFLRRWSVICVDVAIVCTCKMYNNVNWGNYVLQACENVLYISTRYRPTQLCWDKKSPVDVFWHFPETIGKFRPHFTRLLHVPVYARLHIFIQLSAPLTKLCHD